MDDMAPDRTALDAAHAVMTARPEDDAARLAYYGCLADSDLFVLLAAEATADRVSPTIVSLGGAPHVVAFDTEARLAAFVGRVADYAALSGRGLAEMLAGQGIGVALNPDVAPSAFVVPPEAVDWLAETLARAPQEAVGRVVDVTPPGPLPDALMTGLRTKLRGAGGLAEAAWMVGVTYADGKRGHLLAFVEALPDAKPGLAVAANEALTFSGIEAGAMDVTFVAADSPVAARLARVGQAVPLPMPERPDAPRAPGTDPDRPPRLR